MLTFVAVEFDAAKDAANRAKHGLSLALGAAVLAAAVGEEEDRRRAYGEARWIAFGLVGGRLLACVHTRRGTTARIISVRVASGKERARWLS